MPNSRPQHVAVPVPGRADGGVTYLLLRHTCRGGVGRAADAPLRVWGRLVRSPFDNEMVRSPERPQFRLVVGTHCLVRGLFFGRGVTMRKSRQLHVTGGGPVPMPGRAVGGDGR
jgi:hypothetical protein